MDPMRGALNLARRAEGLAKKERNSLAVIVDKRSGPPVEVVGTWGTLDVKLDDYVTMHRKDQVPDGAAYELRELGRLVAWSEDDAKSKDETLKTKQADLESLVKKEAARILGRKQAEHGEKQAIDPEVLKRLLDEFKTLPVSEVANRLIVARLLAKAADEATPPTTGGQP